MRDLVMLFVHLIATVVKLLRPGGARAVVAESLLLKHQLLILNRSRARAPNLRPIHCGPLRGPDAPLPPPAFSDRAPAFDDHGVPPRIGEAQVPLAIHAKTASEARPQRARSGADHCHRRDETPESAIRLPADRPTARFYVRRRARQGCRAPCARQALPARARLSRPVLAHVSRTLQR